MPFLNIRYYEFLDFTIDYYQWPDAPDYVSSFLAHYRRVTRRQQVTDNAVELRATPFYFAVCPNCAITVLTNRDVGHHITCRLCGARWHTSRVPGDELDRIAATVSSALGVT
ncbi:MAG: hypothetical protein ACRDTH_00450 [Pseudonocardiaceae bacterium]